MAHYDKKECEEFYVLAKDDNDNEFKYFLNRTLEKDGSVIYFDRDRAMKFVNTEVRGKLSKFFVPILLLNFIPNNKQPSYHSPSSQPSPLSRHLKWAT